jgi:hypothetical protein
LRPYRTSKRNLLTLSLVFLGIVALTFALVGCEDLSTEPDQPGDMAPPGEAQPMQPGLGEQPMEPGPGEAGPMEPSPGEEPGDIAAPPSEAMEIPPIDEATIKNLTAAASTFTATQINVMDYANFGDWAAARVGVSGQESQLAIFRYAGSAWALYDMGSYVEPGDLPPGIPPEVSSWAFT